MHQAAPTGPRRYPFVPRNSPQRLLVNMLHQTPKGLPEPGDYHPGSWLDVVGLLMARIGLALVVGMTLTM